MERLIKIVDYGQKANYCLSPSLNNVFSGVVARVESLRGRMGESTRQVEGLFESLLAETIPQRDNVLIG